MGINSGFKVLILILGLKNTVLLDVTSWSIVCLYHTTAGEKQYRAPGHQGDYILEGKGTAIPLQAWRGPEGSRRLRLPDFNEGGKVVSLTHQPPLPPGNIPGTHFC